MAHIKKLQFSSVEELAEQIYASALSDGANTSAVMGYENMTALIKSLLEMEGTSIEMIDISNPDFNGYDREYLLTMTSDLELFVERAYVEGDKYTGYLNPETDVVFCETPLNIDIVSSESYSSCVLYAVCFEDEDDECDDGECCGCCECCDKCEDGEDEAYVELTIRIPMSEINDL